MQQGMTMMGDMMRGQAGGQAGGQAQGGQCAANDTACGMQRMQGQQDMMRQHMVMMQQMMGQMMQRDAQPEGGETPEQKNHEEHH
jgi:hypothetical protein